MLKINSKNYSKNDIVEVEIDNKVYKLPLVKYLPYKSVKKLMALQNDQQNIDAVIDVMSEFIPMKVLDELSIDNIGEILSVWTSVEDDALKN